MRLENARHHDHPHRVHGLAGDFRLLDVWEVPVDGAPDFPHFLGVVLSNGFKADVVSGALFAIRARLGEWFGWDREVERAIPGCKESSLVHRLDDEDRARSTIVPGSVTVTPFGKIRHVYRFEKETLLELSNATIHALLHFSWYPGERPRVAVYIKTRGTMSRIYMLAIEPFRHLFVYPAWTARLAREIRNA